MSLMIHHMASETERRFRFEQADRDRLLAGAWAARASTRPDHLTAIRQRSGNALVRIGSSLSGTPIPEAGAISPAFS